jgi:tetratricopeptide (TPR) repeat protein
VGDPGRWRRAELSEYVSAFIFVLKTILVGTHFRVMGTKFYRLIGVALVMVGLVSCQLSGGPDAERRKAPQKAVPSLSGNYLASRYAQARHKTSLAANYMAAALKESPDNLNLLQRTFVLMLAEGRMKEAIVLARRVVAKKPELPIASLTVIVDDVRNERFEDARKYLAKSSDNGINSFITPVLGAWISFGENANADEAVKALAPLSENQGTQVLHDQHAALIRDLAGQTDKAEQHYLSAMTNQKALSLRMVELLGALYERQGETDNAKQLYDKFQEGRASLRILEPALERLKAGKKPPLEVKSPAAGIAEGLYGVGGSFRQQNVRETWLPLVLGRLGLYLKPDFPALQLMVGEILDAGGNPESANSMYRSISPDTPLGRMARFQIATNMNRMGRFDEAVKIFRKIVKERPGWAEPLINLGDILRANQRFEEAVVAYDQAFSALGELEPRHWRLLYARGIALERSGKWARAEADFLAALVFEPDEPYVLNYLGYSWVEKKTNLSEAREMIERAVDLRPRDGYIADSLGWVLYRLGEYEEAVEILERAVALAPDDPVINVHLGDAFWEVGRTTEARFQWNRALVLKPEPDLIKEIEEKLKRKPGI